MLSEIADCAIATDDWKLAIDTTSMMMKEEPIIGHDRRAKAYLAMHQPKDALIDCNYVVDTYKKKFARINKESRES
ncbi:hypothetical protein ABI161_15625, partial [Enterococcus faecium]|uniref:hypothetical protein n=1 Tax=Enterococcus faecium TaxID=1352 RepID=UPI003F43C704